MRSWLKKVIKGSEQGQKIKQEMDQGIKDTKNVIVSFEKHEQRKERKGLILKEGKSRNQSTDCQHVSHCKKTSNFSNQSQYDQSKTYPHYVRSLSKQKEDPKDDDVKSEFGSQLSDNDSQEEVSEEILNNLIDMQEFINMTKNIPQLKGEFITIRHINHLLSKDQLIHNHQLQNYLINKTSEHLSTYSQKYLSSQNQAAYKRFLSKIVKNNQLSSSKSKQNAIFKFYFTTFSNGLIFQYYPLRALLWKILSRYLPSSKEKWIWKMQVSLLKYRQLVKENIIQNIIKKKSSLKRNLLLNQTSQTSLTQSQLDIMRKNKNNETIKVNNQDTISNYNKQTKQKDHPLNSKQNSKWKSYFNDFQLWNIIQRDTMRTRQGYSFFKQITLFSLTNDEVSKQNDLVKVEMKNGQKIQFSLRQLHLSKNKKDYTTYIDSLTRIIFIYLKVNPDQKYYQGINQFVALIYYSFTNKNSQYFRRVSQSDTYQVFTLLMKNLNSSPFHFPENVKIPYFNHFISGQKYFSLLQKMLKKYDLKLYNLLQITKSFQSLKAISIRWFMSIFLSQFSLDEALIIWDVVMVLIAKKDAKQSNKGKQVLQNMKLTQFILYMALGVIHLNRKEIIESVQESTKKEQSFSNLMILKIFEKINKKPEQIIQKTMNLYKSFPNLLQ